MFFLPELSFLDHAFDLITLVFIAAILFLSLLSLCFIFHLRLKSRVAHHLQSFNSVWTVRFLLVAFISLWALNELLRISFFRRRFVYPFLPPIPPSLQSNLCKVQVVLSLGFFEPAFLVTILFLVNVSIKKRFSSKHDVWAIGFVLITCVPVLLLQIFVVFFLPLMDLGLPGIFRRSHAAIDPVEQNATVLCSYPLASTVVFGAFGGCYLLYFLFSCIKVLSLVINKSLRFRIYGLASAILITIPFQILFLGLSTFWRPNEPVHSALVLVVFVFTHFCAVVGEGILVIKPIKESLSAGGDCCRWNKPLAGYEGESSSTSV